jgi:hypothetical protein
MAFEHHRLKGDKERAFSDLLSDLDLHNPPCADLQANRMFYALATLAYNALMALKLIHLLAQVDEREVGWPTDYFPAVGVHPARVPVLLQQHGPLAVVADPSSDQHARAKATIPV